MYSIKQARRALERVDLVEGLPIPEVHRRLGIGVRLGDTGRGILAFYLADLADRRGNQLTGHRLATQFAEQRLGLDRRRAGELIATGRKLRQLPLIHRAFCAAQIGWSKLIELVKVAVPEHEEAWLAEARRLGVVKLRDKVAKSREGARPPKDGDMKGTREPRYPVRAVLGQLEHDLFENAMQKLADERGEPLSPARFLDIASRLILSTEDDGSVPGRNRVDQSLYQIVVSEPDEGATPDAESAAICCDGERTGDGEHPHVDQKTPPRMRKRVLLRDRLRCRACGNRHSLEAHHIRYRDDGGPTKMWNLITVCNGCHSLIHADLLRIEGRTQKHARFVDRDGRPLAAVGEYASRDALLQLQAPEPADSAPGTVETPEPVEPEVAFEGLVGQKARVQELAAAAKGSRLRGEPMPHTLFLGPPGTGKTTLARGTAKVAGARLTQTSGPLVQSTGALLALLTDLEDGDMLFVDEVHAVPRGVLEALYEALTDRTLAGIDLPRFTLLAATTAEAELDPALISRFGTSIELGRYAEDDLAQLIQRKAAAEGRRLDREAARQIAAHARGTPRAALRLWDRVLNDLLGRGEEELGPDAVNRALLRFGYDEDGLGPDEQRYRDLLGRAHGPLSVAQIARRLRRPVKTVLERIEPELLERDLVRITPRGRVPTPNVRAGIPARTLGSARERVLRYIAGSCSRAGRPRD